MDFRFTQRRPGGRLGRHLESIRCARGRIPHRRERIAPTGSTIAGLVLRPPIRQTPDRGAEFLARTGFPIGPHDRPITDEPPAETCCVSVVTTPVGCRAVFCVAPASLRGRIGDLPALWPAIVGPRAPGGGPHDPRVHRVARDRAARRRRLAAVAIRRADAGQLAAVERELAGR